MDQNILNDLKAGERVVEMQECILHEQTVIKVTVYTGIVKKKNWIFFSKEYKSYEVYEFPFYFESKEFANEFLQHYGKFEVKIDTFFNDDHRYEECYILGLSNFNTRVKYYMVDSFKEKNIHKFHQYGQLTSNGVWGGTVNMDGHIMTLNNQNIKYTDIYLYENIAQETNKVDVFKMVAL